jgi:hypothetical protein
MSEILPVCQHHERDSAGGCSVLERSSHDVQFEAELEATRTGESVEALCSPRYATRSTDGGGARRAPRRVSRALTATP